MDEQLFPIDIHYNKLLDWLVDRRHCEFKWHSQAREIHERVGKALGDLPPSEKLDKLKAKEKLHYYNCQEVLEGLKSTEGESKSLFGQYTSPLVREWAEILKSYEKKNVYLAECAQQLIRNVNYEIPALKQQISKCQQTQRECLKKEGECAANSAMLKEKFETACREMGIQGKSVRDELAFVVSELPSIFETLLAQMPPVLPAITYYQAFLQHIVKRPPTESEFLPLLSYLLKEGNVTIHQWKYGEPPEAPQSDQSRTADQGGEANENGDRDEDGKLLIDWGNGIEIAQPTDETGQIGGINFGEPGIDFGDTEIDFGDSSGVDFDAEPVDLSAIVIEDSGEEREREEEGGGAQPGGIPKEHESLLECPRTRNLLLDDLLELKEFLGQRLRELSSESSSMLLVEQFAGGSEALEMQSKEAVEELLSHVIHILDTLTNSRTQHLFLIKSSPSYLDRLADSLLHPLQLSHRAATQGQTNIGRREEAEETALRLEPQLAAIVTETKELQSKIAADISSRYSNRVVNIMGEINQI